MLAVGARAGEARALLAGAAALLAILVQVVMVEARPGPKPAAVAPSDSWRAIGRLCRARAKSAANPTAIEIGRLARDEYYRFGGHRIDASGRLFSFGVVESEQEEDAQHIADGRYRLRHLGWWNVLGYWARLGENATVTAAAREFLRLKGFEGATGKIEDDDTQPLPALRLSTALDTLDRLIGGLPSATADDAEHRKRLKEILAEALIRAAVNDVAWSAAFIGAVMRQARLQPDQFNYSDNHQAYIHAAVDGAVADIEGRASTQFYRACPPSDARVRVGDMVCYHRVKKLDGTTRVEIREMAMEDRGKPMLERRVRASHCDIVAHVDPRAHLAYVVGGNVQQSVAVKQLVLRRGSLTLAEEQPEGCRRGTRWALPPPSAGVATAPHLSDTCSLNRKQWFVVLQAR